MESSHFAEFAHSRCSPPEMSAANRASTRNARQVVLTCQIDHQSWDQAPSGVLATGQADEQVQTTGQIVWQRM